MKSAVCVMVLALFATCSATEEKKTEKRGIYGLGYGIGGSLPLSHGYYGGVGPYSSGLYGGHGLYSSGLYGGHGLYSSGLYGGHGLYSSGLYGGHGLYSSGLYGGHGLLGAPIVSKTIAAAPLHYPSPYLGHGLYH